MTTTETAPPEAAPAAPARWRLGEPKPGPRQMKAFETALKSLLREHNTTDVLSGVTGVKEDRHSEFAAFAQNRREDVTNAWDGILANYGGVATADNIAQATKDVERAVQLCEGNRPVRDERITPEAADERTRASLERQAKEKEERTKRDAAITAILVKMPPGAQRLIVAEQDKDQSDGMSDYFAHETTRRVAIGWGFNKREDFGVMRRAAAGFPETAHLGTAADAKVEHRENYAGGGGSYLKDGSRHSNGWRVESYRVEGGKVSVYGLVEDALPAPSASPPGSEPGTVVLGSGYTVEAVEHTKRGVTVYLVILAVRVDRIRFETLRSSCKAAGGWYCRAWAGKPGGFAFNTPEAANQWAAATV